MSAGKTIRILRCHDNCESGANNFGSHDDDDNDDDGYDVERWLYG